MEFTVTFCVPASPAAGMVLPLFARFAIAFCLTVPAFADDAALRALISRADLHYPAPVTRSEDGLPVGNGRMGSLVWTTPTALHLQINRVDVQPISASSHSFPERNSDYMGGCGFVDIDFGKGGTDVFSADCGPQHLSIYDGIASVAGRGVAVRVLASPQRDVMAIELAAPAGRGLSFQVELRMLRYLSESVGNYEQRVAEHIVSVRTRNHVAASQLHIVRDRIALTQEFTEGTHFAKSAVAITVLGDKVRAEYANETTVRLTMVGDSARAVILIASAATLSPKDDLLTTVMQSLDRVGENTKSEPRATFNALADETAAWWHAFWARGALQLHSTDGIAEYVADNYHYFLYLMGATSRGKYPPKFNGMIWSTAGDLRIWGAQHWFANLSCYYEALFASNRLELLDPVFDMYSGMFDSAAVAAQQQWGSQGIFIPETVWFDGLAKLPDDIAAEMRELYLLHKPWAERSAKFMEFASTENPHSSRWNWIGGGSWVEGRWVPTERGFGPYGPVTHNFGTTAKVAYLFWRRYEYTLDREWLRTRAYPMLKGAAELYRNFPNFHQDADGLYHIHHMNSNESVLGARDSDEDQSAMRGAFATAIRAAEILEVDAPLRAQWRDVLDHLAPLATSTDADALKPADYTGARVFVRGRTPAVNARGFLPDSNSLPQWFFDLCNVDSLDKEQLAVANATFERSFHTGIDDKTTVGVLSKLAVAGATLGRVEAARFLVPNQMRGLTAERNGVYRGGQPFANHLSFREGVQAFDAQRLGRAADALEIALLNSTPPAPAGEPILRVFGAWPREWDAKYTLRARGGFVVTAEQKEGRVAFVEVISEAGALLRLHNPWGDAPIVVERTNGQQQNVTGAVVEIPTTKGERIRLVANSPR
jgi:hypothetical protein